MNLPARNPFISPEEYLQGEPASDIRHEYVSGQVFAMAGAGENHNRISLNIAYHLRAAARGKPCGVFISDMKVRVKQQDAYYYPDVLVACEPLDTEALYKESPCLIAEVLSPATETTDRREKLHAYRTLPSLRYYLLVSQEQRRVECYFRDDGERWLFLVLENTGRLEIACDGYTAAFTLDDIYEDVLL